MVTNTSHLKKKPIKSPQAVTKRPKEPRIQHLFLHKKKMNLSTLSHMLFILSLILISHAPWETLGASLFESLCEEARENKGRCLELVKADPNILGAKDYTKLSKFILKLSLQKGTDAQKYLKEMMRTNPSPALTECATVLYDGVVGSFKSSLGELKEDGLTANYDAKVASDGPTTCDRALAAANISNPSISKLNNDIMLLSQLAYLATNHLPVDV
ncbi:hypothetical protein CR513_31380, partial [Mucuna pruriens]